MEDKHEIKDFVRKTLKLGDIVWRPNGGSRGNIGYFGVVASIDGQKFAELDCMYSEIKRPKVRVGKIYFDKNGKVENTANSGLIMNRTGGDMLIINDLQPSDREYHSRAIRLRKSILEIVKNNKLNER